MVKTPEVFTVFIFSVAANIKTDEFTKAYSLEIMEVNFKRNKRMRGPASWKQTGKYTGQVCHENAFFLIDTLYSIYT